MHIESLDGIWYVSFFIHPLPIVKYFSERFYNKDRVNSVHKIKTEEDTRS